MLIWACKDQFAKDRNKPDDMTSCYYDQAYAKRSTDSQSVLYNAHGLILIQPPGLETQTGYAVHTVISGRAGSLTLLILSLLRDQFMVLHSSSCGLPRQYASDSYLTQISFPADAHFSVQLRCISKYRNEAVQVIKTRPASDSIPVKYLISPMGSISPKPRVVNVVKEK